MPVRSDAPVVRRIGGALRPKRLPGGNRERYTDRVNFFDTREGIR